MYASECVGQAFVVSGQASEACCPGEGAFDDPSARQEHETSFCPRVLDHFEPYAVLLGGLGGVRTGVALVDIGQLHRASGDLLDLFGQRRNLIAIALVGRRHGKR